MQPPQATNETRVPRQVTARLANAMERRRVAGEPDTPPAVDGAPATDVPAQAATPPANQQTVDPRHSTVEYWKQRFDVTQGILTKERQQRVDERDGLQSRITELQTEVQTLKQAAPPTQIDLGAYFTPEQIETYGEVQCRVMAETAAKAATTKAQELIEAAVAPLRQQAKDKAVNDVEARKAAFVEKLTELVPDWQVTDKDQRWLDWLEEEDEHGARRQDVLDQHINRGNATGAAKMFRSFGKTIVVPTPPVAPSATGAGGGDGAPPATPGLTPPTDAEVKDFYKRAALGKVKDEERTAFEARRKLRAPGR